MEKIKFIFLGSLLVLFFSACKETTNSATPSSTTYLPKMELQGDSYVTVECGGTYTDAGIEVTESGATISHEESTSGAYFGSAAVAGADLYTTSYSATNKDGIPGSAFRTVLVKPCNTGAAEDIAGLYKSNTLRSNGEEYDISYVFIVKTGANTYALSDCVGGFYDYGRGYGSDYSCKGTIITVNDISTNDFSATTGQFPVWGNTVDISDIAKAADGTITFHALADFGGEWDMILTPQ